MSSTKLDIVTVTYNHSIHQLRVFLSSLCHQDDNRWKCYLLHDGPGTQGFLQAKKEYSEIERIEFIETEVRQGKYGHPLRKYGLENFVSSEFVNFQNADNYVVPIFVKLMLTEAISTNMDFVFCNQIHNIPIHNRPHKYGLMDSKLEATQIDMANFIVRSTIAKSVGFNSVRYGADWDFINEILKKFPKIKTKKIHNILSIHN